MWLNEALKGLKCQIGYKILLVLMLTGCLTLATIAYRNYQNVQADTMPYEGLNADESVYQVTDMLDGEMEKRFFQDPQAVHKLGEYLNELQSSEEFPYLILNKASVSLDEKRLPREFYYGAHLHMEDGAAVFDGWGQIMEEGYQDGSLGLKASQINENLLAWQPIPIESGRAFDSSDFIYQKGKPIPIILGSAYRSYFALGDILSGSFLITNVQFEVVGFAGKNTFLPFSLTPEYIDYRILAPTLTFIEAPETEEDAFFEKAFYLNMFAGYFPVPDRSYFPALVEHITGLCDKHGLFAPVFFNTDNSAVQLMSLSGTQWLSKVRWIAMLVILFSMLVFSLLVQASTRQHLHRFAVLHVLGKSRMQVVCIVIGETALLYFFALLFSSAIQAFALEMPPDALLGMSLIGSLASIICALPSIFQVMQMNFVDYLKELA